MSDRPKLDTRPARQLTSREVSKIIGVVIGGLMDWCSYEDVRTAVKWWADVIDTYHDHVELMQVDDELDVDVVTEQGAYPRKAICPKCSCPIITDPLPPGSAVVIVCPDCGDDFQYQEN